MAFSVDKGNGVFMSAVWRGLLKQWLAAGLVWWLAGMLLVPASKLYHQILIALSWLPGLLAFIGCREVRQGWRQPMTAVLALFALWSVCSALWTEGGVAFGDLKIFLYLFLAINAFIALACLDFVMLRRALAIGGLLVGVLAWVSVLHFYGWQGYGWHRRAVGVGIVDHPILAGHLFGAVGVLLYYLRRDLPVRLQGMVWGLGCTGVLAFLLMCQSKGPWLAAAVTLVLMALWLQTRRALASVFLFTVLAVLALLIWPELILKRGFSYRPELFAQALQLIREAPLTGLGFGGQYLLLVPSSGKYYEHAHNIYLHITVVLGGVGLLFWLLLQLCAFYSVWLNRCEPAGQALAALLLFSGLALFTDGVGPWVKPREEWFTLWLPLCFAMALMCWHRMSRRAGSSHG